MEKEIKMPPSIMKPSGQVSSSTGAQTWSYNQVLPNTKYQTKRDEANLISWGTVLRKVGATANVDPWHPPNVDPWPMVPATFFLVRSDWDLIEMGWCKQRKTVPQIVQSHAMKGLKINFHFQLSRFEDQRLLFSFTLWVFFFLKRGREHM